MNSEGNTNNRSRSEQRSKRKKTNLILNSLIVIVILLIVFVSYTIFSSKDEANGDKTAKNKIAETQKDDNQAETVNGNKEETTDADEEKMLEEESKIEEEEIVTEGGSDSNVVKTIKNSSWESVGTTQTGEHRAVYSEGKDWDEQVKALAYGSGLDESDMVVWFLGNNNYDPQKSIGTVSSKDKSKKYRVYIEWVDQKGWKPVKVEEIKDLNIR